ncbi:shugoshin 1 [Chanos chanos]|uniref:Shugoshin 1 n=1 Tax=Chanos chanos TaxID=29144 RepID=A0A6J2WM82_CHACN|nr:shugoshin 1 [Chanos chanos]
MVRERVAQKKSFQQSLDDIKEKMKDKRNKRLASASAASRGLSKMKNKNNGTVKPFVLKSVQVNNKALALALQAEREKVRQAQGIILQLKKERQALIFHLLLLKRTLKEQGQGTGAQAQVSSPDQPELCPPAEICPRPVTCVEPTVREDVFISETPEELPGPAQTDTDPGCPGDSPVVLPPTVGTRRRRSRQSQRVRRQSSLFVPTSPQEPVREETEPQEMQKLSMGMTLCPTEERVMNEGLTGELNSGNQLVDGLDVGLVSELSHLPAVQHSTPEPPRQASRQPRKRPAQPAAQSRPERGRKPDRAPLKKPWENSKPRARSKSRDRPNSRARPVPLPGDRLNSSLGGNDTFDFDCEEGVHLTPFRSGVKASQECSQDKPVKESAPPSPAGATMETVASTEEEESESEDSLYVPEKKSKARTLPPRRARSKRRMSLESRRNRDKENIPLKGPCDLSDNQQASAAVAVEADSPMAPVSPVLDTELMLNDVPIRGLTDLSGQSPSIRKLTDLSSQSPSIRKLTDFSSQSPSVDSSVSLVTARGRRKGGLIVRSCLGLGLSDVTNLSPAAYQKPFSGRESTPGPARKRRRTGAVNYKEPSLSSKLRRGDKFTDTQFLRSPIFKQKSRRSLKTQEKYNESFVGCR